jgi:hypothetical protein
MTSPARIPYLACSTDREVAVAVFTDATATLRERALAERLYTVDDRIEDRLDDLFAPPLDEIEYLQSENGQLIEKLDGMRLDLDEARDEIIRLRARLKDLDEIRRGIDLA